MKQSSVTMRTFNKFGDRFPYQVYDFETVKDAKEKAKQLRRGRRAIKNLWKRHDHGSILEEICTCWEDSYGDKVIVSQKTYLR